MHFTLMCNQKFVLLCSLMSDPLRFLIAINKICSVGMPGELSQLQVTTKLKIAKLFMILLISLKTVMMHNLSTNEYIN